MRKVVISVWMAGMLGAIAPLSHAATYRDTVLADNPVAYYRFSETSYGAAASEVNSPANNGFYLGNPTIAQPSLSSLTPEPTYCVSFDGQNDFVYTPRTIADDFSIEFWMNTTANSLTATGDAVRGNGLIYSDVPGSANDFTVGLLNNKVQFYTGDNGVNISSVTDVVDGKWHHVVATRLRGVSLSLYIDGVLEAVGAAGTASLTANSEIDIGGNTFDSRYYQGKLDEVAYYNYALNSGQVVAHDAVAVPEPMGAPMGVAMLGMMGLGRLRFRRK
jgi:hypothetical protein